MAFMESEHPRDAAGKFVKGEGNGDDPEEIAKGIFPHLTGEKKCVKIVMILYVGGLCMAVNESELLDQQRQRRKRINRMKTSIVMTIAIWMLASFVAIIILSLQVVKLNSQMSDIMENG